MSGIDIGMTDNERPRRAARLLDRLGLADRVGGGSSARVPSPEPDRTWSRRSPKGFSVRSRLGRWIDGERPWWGWVAELTLAAACVVLAVGLGAVLRGMVA